MEHKLEIDPAWGRRSDDRKKPGGVHGVTMRWLSIGEKGVVQFMLYTNWMPSHMRYERSGMDTVQRVLVEPLPADLGYHSPVPLWESEYAKPGKCQYLPGGECYYDGSSLNAMDAFKVLTDEGGDKLWEFLDAYYECVFNDGPYPGTNEWKKLGEALARRAGFSTP